MVKKKTKKQKDMDAANLTEQYEALAAAGLEFAETLCDCEMDTTCLRMGTVAAIMSASREIRWARARVLEEYTFTHAQEDRANHPDFDFDNSTHVDHYKEGAA